MTAERTGEYTPTTGEVRADYVRDHTRGFDSYQAGRSLTSEQEYHGSEFDRWLARVIAEAEARGAREAAEVVCGLAASSDFMADQVSDAGLRWFEAEVREWAEGIDGQHVHTFDAEGCVRCDAPTPRRVGQAGSES